MQVKDVMTERVVIVPAGDTLREASRRMVENNIGSVVVLYDNDAPGILTDTDVLRYAVKTDCSGSPLSETEAGEPATSPVVTISPNRTVRHAVDKMVENRIKHLPVVEDKVEPIGEQPKIEGIVTMLDISLRYDDIRTEAVSLARKPDSFKTEHQLPYER